jgi:hypothetical protein
MAAPESAGKRQRSPTPPAFVAMVEGIEEEGFRLRSGLIMYPQTGTPLLDSAHDLKVDMSEFIAEVVAVQISAESSSSFENTVRVVNVLYEIAASLTTMGAFADHDQQLKLDALHQHAIEGLDLIGGAEALDMCFDEEI